MLERLREVLDRAYEDILGVARKHNCTMRRAAMLLAVDQIAAACELRGAQ